MEPLKTASRLWNGQEMFSLIEQCEQSELSIKSFCALHQIAPSNYYYWRKKYRSHDEVSDDEQDSFSMLQVEEEPDTMTGLFAAVNGIKIYQPVSAAFLKELAS